MRRSILGILTVFFGVMAGGVAGAGEVTFELVSASANNADQSSYVVPESGELSPVSGALYYLFIQNSRASPAPVPSVSGSGGWGVTWTKEADVGFSSSFSPTRRLSVFSGVASSELSGALTVSFGASTQTAMGWSLVRVGGNAESVYTVQVKAVAGNGVTSLANYLTVNNGFGDPGNQNLSGFGRNDDAPLAGPAGGFVGISDVGWTGPNGELGVGSKVNVSEAIWTWTGSASVGAISIEVGSGAAEVPALVEVWATLVWIGVFIIGIGMGRA